MLTAQCLDLVISLVNSKNVSAIKLMVPFKENIDRAKVWRKKYEDLWEQ